MRLNNLFTPKNKRPTTEYFLAVEIHESMIKSAVWQVEDEAPSIVALGSYELWDSEDSLINGVDASLTAATKGLDVPPDRVIFGLPDSWLVENKIHSTKQKVIAHLIKELNLKPIGLVTISEAIVQQLKSQEGIPPTAILLEIYPSKVIVSLVNVGQIQALEEVGRSDDLARDVEEGLARFDVEKLPTRFILTNGSDLENEEQQIISYSWTDKLPFLHLPKVQSLPIDFSIKAIALSGGTEAAKSLGFSVATPAEELPSPVKEPEEELSEIGFSLETEKLPPPPITPEPTQPIPPTEPSFVVEPKPNLLHKLSQLKSGLHLPTLPKITFVPSRRLVLIALPALLILIFAGIAGFYFYFGKVEISLALTPQHLSQDLDLTIASTDKSGGVTVLATQKTLTAKSSGSQTTSGESLVGDKTTGKVTIYSKLGTTLNLKAGTKFTSPNGLVFFLDTVTTVASSSADSTPPFAPGTAIVSLTAGKFGAEYNLDKNSQFSVADNPKSNVVAINDTAFAGGSSRTVKAVAKADLEKVLGAATDKIKGQIGDQLRQNDPDSRFVSLGQIRYVTKNFDHSVGEEAASVNLDLEGQQDVLIYSYKQIVDLINQKIKDNIGAGLVLSQKDVSVTLSDPVANPDNTFTTKAHIDALLLPVIDQSKLVSVVRGKKVEVLKNILQNTPGFHSAKLAISPQLPLLSDYLPMRADRIHLTISATP